MRFDRVSICLLAAVCGCSFTRSLSVSSSPSTTASSSGASGDGPWNDPKYQGQVPEEYFAYDMMKDKERELASAVEGAADRCKRPLEVVVDWGSTKGQSWNTDWNPIGVLGNCVQMLQALGGACYDGKRKKLAQVTTIRCYIDETAAVDSRFHFSDTVHSPVLRIEGTTLHGGYRKDMAFDDAVSHFLDDAPRSAQR